jgi:hypothetical protein
MQLVERESKADCIHDFPSGIFNIGFKRDWNILLQQKKFVMNLWLLIRHFSNLNYCTLHIAILFIKKVTSKLSRMQPAGRQTIAGHILL